MPPLPRPAPPPVSLGRQIQLTAKVVGERFTQAQDRAGLGHPLYLALDQLVREDGLRQCDLAARLRLESPTLTDHLDHLVERGLVVRGADAADRRAIRVRITPRGREAHAVGAAVARRLDAELAGVLTGAEAALVTTLLAQVEAGARRPDSREVAR
ncbi:MAG TPA: MarR family transcriptional regulator [Candidatus Micrarchaeia archaeon]|nr:MarR family transcriptional regulator [Candidatus Micrarchaeia archaeon]